MHRRFQISVILLAWLAASGGQWDLIQTFAWGRMIANYAESMPLRAAVELTFAPGNSCAICRAVSDAKRQESSPAAPGARAEKKLVLVFHPFRKPTFTAAPREPWYLNALGALSAPRSIPPTPPPRVA